MNNFEKDFLFFIFYLFFLKRILSNILVLVCGLFNTALCTPIQVEASAFLWAVQKATLEGWSHVIFKSDSKECIDPVISALSLDQSISNISSLAESFSKCSFSWVRRLENYVAYNADKIFLNSMISHNNGVKLLKC